MESVDDGYEGDSLWRPGIDQIRRRVAQGGVDLVLAMERDRIARKRGYVFVLEEEFRDHNCALRALEDKDEDSAEECLMRAIMSSILYSRTLRLRSFFASLSVDCIPKPSYGHGEDNVAKSQRGKEDQRTYYEECGGRPRVGPGLEHGHS